MLATGSSTLIDTKMLFKRSIIARALSAMLACVAITSVITVIILEQRITHEEQSYALERLRHVNSQVQADYSALINDTFMAELRKFTTETAATFGVRVTVFDSHKKPISDSFSNLRNADNLPGKQELVFGDDKENLIVSRYSSIMEADVLWYSSKLWDNGALVGYLRLGYTLERLSTMKSLIRWSILFSAAATALLLLIPTMRFANKIRSPLLTMARQLSKPAEAIQLDENLQIRLDETGLLARGIINSRQRFSASIRASEENRKMLERSLMAIEDGIVAIDINERLLFMNSAAARYFHINLDDVAGKSLWEIVRKHPVVTEMHDLLESGSIHAKESRFFNSQGEEMFAHLQATPLVSDKTNERVGTLMIVSDSTQINKLLQSREDLITNVSHEFKTPLTAIQGITETLLDDKDMPESTRTRFLERIQQQSERLKNIARDLLELVRIESNTDYEDIEDVDIRPIVESVFETMSERAELKHLEYEFLNSKHPLTIMIRPKAMEQITENLIDNALKYTHENGKISVRLSANAGWAIIEVSDNGIGIEDSDIDRVFERFYRTKAARTPGTEGTGLGLAIVKSLVEYYEGEITVSSYYGKGSIFCVSLPLKPQK